MDTIHCTEQTKWPPFVYKCTDQCKIWKVRRYEYVYATGEILLVSLKLRVTLQNIDLHIFLTRGVILLPFQVFIVTVIVVLNLIMFLVVNSK